MPNCQYLQPVKMSLLQTIDAFYVEVLCRLPKDAVVAVGTHHRGLLVSGHCYSPLDPTSNIVLNSVRR